MIDIKLSVRNLVEFILRSGDIDSGFVSMGRALEGSKAHRKLQKSYDDNYQPEVQLKKTIEFEKYNLTIEGRADGIHTLIDGVIIDEIKSTTVPLEAIHENYNHAHWAQAMCYGYIYGAENGLSSLTIQLTYIHLETEEVKRIKKNFTIEELKSFFFNLIEKYCVWADLNNSWIAIRNNSIEKLRFPFPDYRKGQREMAAAVYRSIRDENTLFVQAPTGIGKTISVIFPAVKSIGEGKTSKIFYLTGKTTTQRIAEDTFQIMREKGLQLISITITAKDKICFMDERNCTPKQCKYAKGHYDRVNDALMDMLQNETFIDRDKIRAYAEKHEICPFEYSLDLALWADCVICDYNYLFDPNASLKRFFTDRKTDFVFLIDEAHNLADRGREMFSAELQKKDFLGLKRKMKEIDKGLYTISNEINKYFISLRKKLGDDNNLSFYNEERDLYHLLMSFTTKAEKHLTMGDRQNTNQELLDSYFNVLNFLKISELYDEHYTTYVERYGNNISIKLFCLDPSLLLSQITKKGKTAVFFSATLLPKDYFLEILGGNEESKFLSLSSPFDIKNRCLLVADNVQTRYSKRDTSYDKIAEYINSTVLQKPGNYIVYFPSYKYMNDVYDRFIEKYDGFSVNVQSPGMTDSEKDEFIEFFEPDPKGHKIGFCVLGGVYSEGIDLTDDRLIGVIIVGVGLPQLCFERNIIKEYYDKKNGRGFQYSYMYPGMNKVMQAAGRLIRTHTDRGVILLIDERFSHSNYQKLFPREWFPYKKVNEDILPKVLAEFWL